MLLLPKNRSTIAPQFSALIILFAAFVLRFHRLASVPFGWHPDEATKALLARDVLDGKFLPLFFSAFTGREALYVYLEAGAFTLFGESIFSARVLSAFVGLLTVALTITLGRELFSRRVGLAAGALMALSLWHIIASRNGYRAVIQPLVQLPVLILALRGLRAPRARAIRHFALAGVWLGLTQYTYTAARFFPVACLAIAALAAVTLPQRAKARVSGLLLGGVLAVLVFLPLGVHFLNNPLDFYGRAAQISIFSPDWSGGNPWLRLWQSVKETARMFTVWGDINYRFNVSGQPVFGVVDGALFYLGLLVALWAMVREDGYRRLAHGALFLWMLIMLLPMLLSAESLPYYQRAIGALPAIYFFPALALVALVDGVRQASRREPSQWLPVAGGILVVLLFAGLGWRAYGDYFHQWHNVPRNDDDRRVAMVYVADYLREHALPENIYLSTQYPQHPTLALLAPESYDMIQWFDATQSLPLPLPGTEATYVMLLENRPQPALLEKASGMERIDAGYDRFDRPVFERFRWHGEQWPAPAEREASWSWAVRFDEDTAGDRQPISLPAPFADVVALTGYDFSQEQLRPGQTLELVAYWETMRRPGRAYTFFAHILNSDGEVVAGYDANLYPTAFWREGGGELLLSYFPLSLPADVAGGTYQVEVGVYHQPSGERLIVRDSDEDVADRLLLKPVRVQQ
ncbi:MAG TPA: glycosyltransferase family 39 protein [Candidatus Sulfomarinibacteraceae bacterium]|nr:glycosyltransferase family 39 protein [Candidatus Sulfomarinibacteraceae bacterium]